MISKEHSVRVSAVIVLLPWPTERPMRAEDVTFLCFSHIYLWDEQRDRETDIFQMAFLLLLIQSVCTNITVWE